MTDMYFTLSRFILDLELGILLYTCFGAFSDARICVWIVSCFFAPLTDQQSTHSTISMILPVSSTVLHAERQVVIQMSWRVRRPRFQSIQSVVVKRKFRCARIAATLSDGWDTAN